MIPPFWPWLLVAAVSASAGAGIAWRIASDHGEARIASLKAEYAAQRQAAAEENARQLAAAQDAERQAVHALHATKNILYATQRRLKESLYALPTASRCGLSGPARGLLNDAITATGGAGLPTGAAQPAGAAAEPAADSGDTGERDLALWIADAIALYGECRARIDAIRAWDEVTHGR